jgi:hypothetical protein
VCRTRGGVDLVCERLLKKKSSSIHTTPIWVRRCAWRTLAPSVELRVRDEVVGR